MYDCHDLLAYIDYWRISVRRNTLKIGRKTCKKRFKRIQVLQAEWNMFFFCTEIVLFLHFEVLKIFYADIANMFFHFPCRFFFHKKWHFLNFKMSSINLPHQHVPQFHNCSWSHQITQHLFVLILFLSVCTKNTEKWEKEGKK